MINYKRLLPFVLLTALSGCSNNELGYNEKVTSIFLLQMSNIDDDQAAFADTSVVFHPDNGQAISLETKADNITQNAVADINDMNALRPSDAAQHFHKNVMTYLEQIKDYGETAKRILAADMIEKRKLYTQLERRYKELNQMPDHLLSIQKEYQSNVGLEPR